MSQNSCHFVTIQVFSSLIWDDTDEQEFFRHKTYTIQTILYIVVEQLIVYDRVEEGLLLVNF